MVCPQCIAVVRQCVVTVAMNSHTKDIYYLISADSMSKIIKRASESHEQIVSRMCEASENQKNMSKP